MNSIVDRIILILFTTLACFLNKPSHVIIPLLLAITFTSVNEFFAKEKLALGLMVCFGILCMFDSAYFIFFPVLLYDLFTTKYQYFGLFGFIPLFIHLKASSLSELILFFCLVACTFWLRRKTVQYALLHQQYILQRDSLTELSLALESKIAELIRKQDDDITLATLNERNRIAREIHDNVGHLLSSSILQLGALITITKEEPLKESLSVLKDTLSSGMDSIRSSIHNLRDDAVDLYAQVNHMINEFSFCNAHLNYDMSDTVPIPIRYAIIGLMKEALSNIIKHSNATQVNVTLYEHPKLYQLIIYDNGTKKTQSNDYGMGLENMKQRVAALHGIINITDTNGFRIFVSFPKENPAT